MEEWFSLWLLLNALGFLFLAIMQSLLMLETVLALQTGLSMILDGWNMPIARGETAMRATPIAACCGLVLEL